MRDCELKQMPNCTIAGIRRCGNLKFKNSKGKRTAREKYVIYVGGTSPCNCMYDVVETVYDYIPPANTPNVVLPQCGDRGTLAGKHYVAMDVDFQEPKKGQCHKIYVNVSWEQNETTISQFEGDSRQPQKADGSPVTDPGDLDEAIASVRFRVGDEKKPCENVQYFGFYDYKGSKHTTDFKDVNYVLTPYKHVTEGDFVPPMNAAGVVFDPPMERDEGILKVVVSRPYAQINGNYLKRLKNKINCDRFHVVDFQGGQPRRGVTILPYTARVTDIQISDNYLKDGLFFSMVTFELSLRENIIETTVDDGQGGSTLVKSEDFGWDELVPNRGLSQIIYPGDPDGHGGTHKSSWSYNDLGYLQGNSNAPILVEGSPISEPTFLDENGRTLAIAEYAVNSDNGSLGVNPAKILYIRMRKYKAIKFASNTNFPGLLGKGFYKGDATPSDIYAPWTTFDDTVLHAYGDMEVCP